MNEETLEGVAHRFSLLADPTRLRILHALIEAGEMSVGRIAQAAHTSRFNASAHLSKLAAGGLLSRRHSGTTVLYRLRDSSLPEICDSMCRALQTHARAIAG